MNAYGYARVSSAGQEDNTSLPVQRERIQAYARAQGWARPQVIEEVGSGAEPNRPGLASLREMVTEGDTIVVLRLDRLFRSVVDGLPFFKAMEARGVAIRSVTEQIDTGSPMGRLQLTLILAFATAERELIGERMASGKARNAQDGKFNGGPIPFGYRRAVGGAHDFEPEPTEAEVVRRLFKLYSSGRHGLRRLRSETGCRLSESAIAELLANPFYVGQVRYRGVVRPNAHVPLVSRSLFARVQRVRSERAARRSPAEVHEDRGSSPQK
jgi:site-specific DNA recombinase